MIKVKICGVTHPKDAELAASLGADYIGIIFSDRSKRKVSLPLAKNIVNAAKLTGAEPIGVFINETKDQIISICEQIELSMVQLHGAISQGALDGLIGHYSIIYAISVKEHGAISQQQTLPASVVPLYDNLSGGTGASFDWTSFSPPNTPWILAGGLNPSNVSKAIISLKPTGVDVATGVEYPNSTRKDPLLVKAFIQAAKQIKERL